jgi:alpha-tubulin suppressor-like RCC1 family protein
VSYSLLRFGPARLPAALGLLLAFALLCAPFRATAQTATANALSAALDAPALNFTSSGTGAWFSQTKVTRDGVDAVQSGVLAASAKATLNVTVAGVTKFSFKWKVSSEGNRDILTFYIDNVAQPNPISGKVDWQTRTYTLSGSGNHTLRWEYAKDASVSSNLDAAWVDQFTVLDTFAPRIQTEPADVQIAPDETATFEVVPFGTAADVSYQWYQGERGDTSKPLAFATGSRFSTPPLLATTRYWVRLTKNNATLDSRTAVATVAPRALQTLLATGSSSSGALIVETDEPLLLPAPTGFYATKVAAGENHTLFIRANGALWGVGANEAGQLGDGTTDNRAAPVRIVESGVVQVASGAGHSLFLKSDGTLWGMGANDDDQLGVAPTTAEANKPYQLSTDVVQFAGGDAHSVYLKNDGKLYALGKYGAEASSATPIEIATGVRSFATGHFHTLFIKTDGTLWAFGQNERGQLGTGDLVGADTPVQIAAEVMHVAAGGLHSLFVRADGSVWVMGDNTHGQLGLGSADSVEHPVPQLAPFSAARIIAGAAHTFLLKRDGSLWAMGANSEGQLGDGTTEDRFSPVLVASNGIVDLATASTHTLLLQTPATPTFTVTFALGEGAARTGGGELVQTIKIGEAALAPVFTAPEGKVFREWDRSFDLITASITVTAVYDQTQTIDFAQPEPRIFAAPSGQLTLSATSSSGLPVTLARISGPGTLDGAVLTYTGIGAIVIEATRPAATKDGVSYAAATPVRRTIQITLPPQTLAFDPVPPATATYGDEPISLSATTNVSELTPVISLVSGPATVEGGKVTFTGAGTVVIKATSPANTEFAETSVTHTVTVAKKNLVVFVSNTTRAVASPNPVFVLSYIGLVGSDTPFKAGVITTPPTVSTTATLNSPAGEYPLSLSGGVAPNYTFTLVSPAPMLKVVSFGGSYEALVGGSTDAEEFASPVGKIELTVSSRDLTYTGKLLLGAEAKTVVFRGKLAPSDDASSANLTHTRASTEQLSALAVSITVTNVGISGLVTRGTDASLALAHGVKLGLPAAPEELPASAHTLVLGPGIDSEETIMIAGSGHAKARLLARSANLSLAGKLADGAPLTATLKPTPSRAYRLWFAPYGARRDSFVAGNLKLQAHPDSSREGRFYIPTESDTVVYWRKAPLPPTAKTRDRAYRSGFGPLACAAILDPWFPPQTERTTNPARPAITLAQRLGLADTAAQSGVVEIVHGSDDTDLGTLADDLPSVLVLSPAGRFVIVDPTMPANNPTGWKILSLNPATGAFTGRFLLKEPVPETSRTIKRTIDFSGTLRQAPAGETGAAVAEGFFLLPSLDPAGEASSHEFRLLPAGE